MVGGVVSLKGSCGFSFFASHDNGLIFIPLQTSASERNMFLVVTEMEKSLCIVRKRSFLSKYMLPS
jgi:hypothetical protein